MSMNNNNKVTTVLITGANAGLGYETARQLAGQPGIRKVILGCRNPTKAAQAKKDLEEATGKQDDFYEILTMDVSNLDSVRKAVNEDLKEPVDGLVLNAGGAGGADAGKMTEYGVPAIVAVNILGHVLLVDMLLEQKKLTTGGSVVYAGSEAARGVPSLGMAKPSLQDGSVVEFKTFLDSSAFAKKDMDTMYGPTKLVAALWMSSMARKNKASDNNIRFVTISPGGTAGTEATSELPWYMRMIWESMMKVMFWLGKFHSVDVGAKRYVDALLNEGDAYQSGVFYASKVGVTGEICDQVELFDVFDNQTYQDHASAAINNFIQ